MERPSRKWLHEKRETRDVAHAVRRATGFSPDEVQLVFAAHLAMRDEFPDVPFAGIYLPTCPKVIEYFCYCVRHYWARQDKRRLTECSLTANAITCPFGHAEILSLIARFETEVRPIWMPHPSTAEAVPA